MSVSGSGKVLTDAVRRVSAAQHVDVFTGFDIEVQKSKDIPRAIMRRIKTADAFLAIWTHDFEARSISGLDYFGNPVIASDGYVPSVWMPFELGVAAAYNKPFKVLVVRGTHPLYFQKPFATAPAQVFDAVHFEMEVSASISGLLERIEEERIFPPQEI